MPGDPVAWTAIERGWSVFDADGSEIGKVDQVTGDLSSDIFNGLTFGDGGTVLTRTRYVTSEHVASIHRGEIVLDLDAGEVAQLEPYTAPVSEPLTALLPEEGEPSAKGSTFVDRLFRRRP